MLLQKDSLDFDDADRAAIAIAVRDAPERAVVITHGTGTMEQTAKWLAAEHSGKTIVLTGAMRPFSLGRSDGPFNLGGAIVAAPILGVPLMIGGYATARSGRRHADKVELELMRVLAAVGRDERPVGLVGRAARRARRAVTSPRTDA